MLSRHRQNTRAPEPLLKMNLPTFKLDLIEFPFLNCLNSQFSVDKTNNFTNQSHFLHQRSSFFSFLFFFFFFCYISNLFWPSLSMPSECKMHSVAGLTVCLGYSHLRLANGGEDRLHLNDVIISDAASCNQGQGTERERSAERCFMPG